MENLCIIGIGNEENHKVVAEIKQINHSLGQKQNGLFFYCLCSIYTMTMTKAKFMIVTPTNPKKSSLMITNKTDSTIAPPPVVNLTS